ncbi:hypothetical protein FAIPA1_700010 [Frankia sp. AiPs1]
MSACAPARPPAPTSPAAPPKARPAERSTAASSTTSPASSTAPSPPHPHSPQPPHQPLDRHRSVRRLGVRFPPSARTVETGQSPAAPIQGAGLCRFLQQRMQRHRRSCDRGDIPVIEVDRLVQPAAERSGVASHHILTGQRTLLDLRNPSLGHTHPLRDLRLRQSPLPAHLSKPMTHRDREEFLATGSNRLFPASPDNLLGTNVRPPCIAAHH